MKRKLVILSFFLLSAVLVRGQENQRDDFEEKIYVHFNSSLFFTGEYLYYKVYLNKVDRQRPEKLSNFAYLELVSASGKQVFNQTVKLEDGVGQGDYFVNNDVPSGNYKLIAYTEYMKNFHHDKFFQADITVINPYRADQRNLLPGKANDSITGGPIEDSSSVGNAFKRSRMAGFEPFELEISGDTFTTRSEISIMLKNNIREAGIGNYSISVRKVDEIPRHQRLTAREYEDYRKYTLAVHENSKRELKFSREIDGIQYSGIIIPESKNASFGPGHVAVSTTGASFVFKVAAINDNGTFNFMLDPEQEADMLTVQALNDNPAKAKLSLHEKETLNYDFIQFGKYQLSPSMKSAIVKRSVRNQIENAYFSIKPDTVLAKAYPKPFVGYEKFVTYDLDEYTRFPTMDEVFTEIVKAVWSEKKEGQRRIRIFHREFSAPSEDPPLIFIDGAFVQYHDEVLSLDADRVKYVRVLRNAYEFGEKDYQGVLLIETKEGDYTPDTEGPYILSKPLVKPVAFKHYFKQDYSDASSYNHKRIPDYREQLFWQPFVLMKSGSWSESFFTSDVTGVYEVIVEGYTNSNIPVSLKKSFRVVNKE